MIHQENKGVSAARNAGLRALKGDYIFFVDSDDLVDSKRLAELLRILVKDNTLDMIVFGMTFDFYSGDQIYGNRLMLPPVDGVIEYDEYTGLLFDLFKNNMVSSLCNRIIRSTVVKGAGLSLREDMFLYEDFEFVLRVLANCRKVRFSLSPIYHYRIIKGKDNFSNRIKKIEHIDEIVNKIEEALTPFGGSFDILLSLYLILAREKLKCSSRIETNDVSNEFKEWIDLHSRRDSILNDEYAMLLYNKRCTKLLVERRITRIRNKLVATVKYYNRLFRGKMK